MGSVHCWEHFPQRAGLLSWDRLWAGSQDPQGERHPRRGTCPGAGSGLHGSLPVQRDDAIVPRPL